MEGGVHHYDAVHALSCTSSREVHLQLIEASPPSSTIWMCFQSSSMGHAVGEHSAFTQTSFSPVEVDDGNALQDVSFPDRMRYGSR